MKFGMRFVIDAAVVSDAFLASHSNIDGEDGAVIVPMFSKPVA